MGINTATVSGRLTRDTELFATTSGLSILKVGLAHNERRKVDEEWVEIPHFFELAIFGGYGEMLHTKLRKGDEVVVTGRLSWSSWENDAGEKRSKIEIVVSQLVGEAVYRPKNGNARLEPDPDEQPALATSHQTDDIPF